MFAFDPMIELVHHDNWLPGGDRAEIYHGLGFSYNRLFGGGEDWDAFNNAAIKVRPIGVRFGRTNLEFDLRIYPNRFNASDFGKVSAGPRGDRCRGGLEPQLRHCNRQIQVSSITVTSIGLSRNDRSVS